MKKSLFVFIRSVFVAHRLGDVYTLKRDDMRLAAMIYTLKRDDIQPKG